jgi:hypothetical protein
VAIQAARTARRRFLYMVVLDMARDGGCNSR